ncbi:hypothetical protein ACLEPN_22085 [Myxococcus sp. 1LA]
MELEKLLSEASVADENDYSYVFDGVVRVRFPRPEQRPDGSWVERWRVDTQRDVAWSSLELEGFSKLMVSPDFEVRIVQHGARVFDLVVTMLDDARQGRFLYAIYNAIRIFDVRVGAIASIEDQPREHWTPLRAWNLPPEK